MRVRPSGWVSGLMRLVHTREGPHEHMVRRGGRQQAGNKGLTRNQAASTLILNFQPPELGENKFVLFKPFCLWRFLLAA